MQHTAPKERTTRSNFAHNNRRATGCRVSGGEGGCGGPTGAKWRDSTASNFGHFNPWERNVGRS